MVPCPSAGAVVAGLLTFYSLIVRGSAVGVLSTGQLIENHGHQSYSKHSVITEDGYLINLFRINKGRGGPPFLLLHALMGASDQWLLRDRNHDLPSILVNNGYDVWLGDFRGNLYSKNHTRLNVSNPEYWKFSIDEWAFYDVPAMMNYVCNNTEYDKMYVVTYSLSSAILFATASARPEYNDKIIVSYHMAPFLAFTNIKSLLLRLGVQFGEFYLAISRSIKNHELFSRNHWSMNSMSLFCNKKSIFLKACVTLLSELFGFDTSGNSTDYGSMGIKSGKSLFITFQHIKKLKNKKKDSEKYETDLDFKLTYSRAGVSLNSIDHLLQMIKAHKFQHYDLGHNKNLKKYGQTKPPEYDLRRVTSPVVLYYSKNDRVVDNGTIHKLISVLPKVYQTIMIPNEKFGHIDYAFNSNAKTLVFDSVINIARQFKIAPSRPQYGYSYYYY
ncbi:lipase 3-like [Aphis craccivora]|uniref:Lipase 3-like n=1 Tax=Aphis craccivora TaxID=307492 RepID=A0A6G0YNT6_APHCR|nr:lipase 3-like [Aphis craccivora]